MLLYVKPRASKLNFEWVQIHCFGKGHWEVRVTAHSEDNEEYKYKYIVNNEEEAISYFKKIN